MNYKILTPFAVATILCGCSSDDEPSRDQAISRTIEWGKTITLTADNYICENDFIGEIGSQDGTSIFISKHVGKCIVYSPANANARYSITVTTTSNAFPDMDLDFGISHEEFLKKHRRAESTSINPLTLTSTENAHLRYSYTFTNGIYTSVTTTFAPGIFATANQTGEDVIKKFLAERYEQSPQTEDVWYNAYTSDKATVKVTISMTEGNLYKLSISMIR